MKHVAFFFCLIFVLASCKKDNPETVIRYTSDVPNEFTTSLSVFYDQDDDQTTARAFFWDEVPDSVGSSEEVLRLPSNSYVNFNGIPMTSETSGGSWLDKVHGGKADGLFEFMNFDQIVYSNFIDMPDTVYLVNLADTIDASQDLQLTFGGPPMEGDETMRVTLSVNNDYGEFYETTADSTIIIPKSYLLSGQEQRLVLSRSKTLVNPNLPVGGGSVSCRYTVSLMIYSE